MVAHPPPGHGGCQSLWFVLTQAAWQGRRMVTITIDIWLRRKGLVRVTMIVILSHFVFCKGRTKRTGALSQFPSSAFQRVIWAAMQWLHVKMMNCIHGDILTRSNDTDVWWWEEKGKLERRSTFLISQLKHWPLCPHLDLANNARFSLLYIDFSCFVSVFVLLCWWALA